VLVTALGSIGTNWSDWRHQRLASEGEPAEPSLTDAVSDSLRLARATAEDGKQRALEHRVADLEDLQGLRVRVNEALAADDGPSTGRVRSWLWNVETSGGSAMTTAGKETGYELRFSRSGP
jgi:hypothetical protein